MILQKCKLHCEPRVNLWYAPRNCKATCEIYRARDAFVQTTFNKVSMQGPYEGMVTEKEGRIYRKKPAVKCSGRF